MAVSSGPALDPTKKLGGFLQTHTSEGWKKRWVSEVDDSLLILKNKFDAQRLGFLELSSIKHIQLGPPSSAQRLEFSLLSSVDVNDRSAPHLEFRAESTSILNYWLKGIESRTNAIISYKTKDERKSVDPAPLDLSDSFASPPRDPDTTPPPSPKALDLSSVDREGEAPPKIASPRRGAKRKSMFVRLQGAITPKQKEEKTAARGSSSVSASIDRLKLPHEAARSLPNTSPASSASAIATGLATHRPPAKALPPVPPKKPLPAPPPSPRAEAAETADHHHYHQHQQQQHPFHSSSAGTPVQVSLAPLGLDLLPITPPLYTKPPLRGAAHRRSGSEGWNRLKLNEAFEAMGTVNNALDIATTTPPPFEERPERAQSVQLTHSSTGLPKGLPPSEPQTQILRVRTTDEAIYKKVNLVNVTRTVQIATTTTVSELLSKMIKNLCRGMDAHLAEYLQRTWEHAKVVIVRDEDPDTVHTMEDHELIWKNASDPCVQVFTSVSPAIVKLLYAKTAASIQQRKQSVITPPVSPRRSADTSTSTSTSTSGALSSLTLGGDLMVGEGGAFITEDSSMVLVSPRDYTCLSGGEPSSPGEEEPQTPEQRLFTKRTNVAREILTSERTYYKVLVAAIEVYREALLKWVVEEHPKAQGGFALLQKSVTINEETIKSIFGNLNIIRGFHQSFLDDLETRMQAWSPEQTIGDVFKQFAPFLRVYVSYSNNYRSSIDLLSKVQESSPAFTDILRSLEEVAGSRCATSSLENMLIQPIQRVPRYVLLLQDLLSKTAAQHPDHAMIDDALNLVLAVSDEVDRNIQEHELRVRLLSTAAKISKRSDLVRADRKLVKEATEMCVTPECTKISKRVRLWLFNDIISHVMTSKSSAAIASTKYQWPLTLVWLHDNYDPTQMLRNNDKYPFGFALVGPKKEYLLRFRTNEEKQSWVVALRQQIQATLDSVYLPEGEQRQLNVDDNLRIGEFLFQDGSRYDGEWNDGRMHGQGRLEIFGNVYTGTFSSSLRQGQGTLQYATGQVYEGYWHNDRPHGEGTLKMADESMYQGQFVAGLMHGTGTFTFRNGDQYEGDWLTNQPSGNGTFTSPSKRLRYEGQWSQGCPHGTGTLKDDSNDSEYVGNFERGYRHGTGELRLKRQGRHYRGGWGFDTRVGAGVEEIFNCAGDLLERYEGDFSDNMRHGQGTVTYFDGSVYSGGFRKGQRHGQGAFQSPAGMVQYYKGDWNRGQMHGKGMLRYQTGFMWAGFFENDCMKGEGILTAPNNSKVEGRFSNQSIPEGRISLWKEDEHHNLVKFSGLVTNDLLIRPTDKSATGVDVPSHPSFFHFTGLSD